jgi:hypothetical protein
MRLRRMTGVAIGCLREVPSHTVNLSGATLQMNRTSGEGGADSPRSRSREAVRMDIHWMVLWSKG